MKSQKIRFGFAGVRHAHIFDLYERALAHPRIEVVGIWESDPEASLLSSRGLERSHSGLEALLSESDVAAVGDAYGRRGAVVLDALRADCSVIADKPLCTRKAELEAITELATKRGKKIGMMLDLRDHANWLTLRRAVQEGRIGRVLTVHFTGQHPLLRKQRPAWYFEPGMHGGTLNDIAIHALDFIPWLTGSPIEMIDHARTWNAKAGDAPHFMDCAQCVFRTADGTSVMGDVSYLAPDTAGYKLDGYWRVTLHGEHGMLETGCNREGVQWVGDRSDRPEILPTTESRPGGYLEDFIGDLDELPESDERLATNDVLRVTSKALELERRARQTPGVAGQ